MKETEKRVQRETKKITTQVAEVADAQTVNELQRQVNNTRLETNIIDNTNENTERVLQAIREEAVRTSERINADLNNIQDNLKAQINDNKDITETDKQNLKNNLARIRGQLREDLKQQLESIVQDRELTPEQKELFLTQRIQLESFIDFFFFTVRKLNF